MYKVELRSHLHADTITFNVKSASIIEHTIKCTDMEGGVIFFNFNVWSTMLLKEVEEP